MQLKAKIFWDAVIAVCMIVLIICGIVLLGEDHLEIDTYLGKEFIQLITIDS